MKCVFDNHEGDLYGNVVLTQNLTAAIKEMIECLVVDDTDSFTLVVAESLPVHETCLVLIVRREAGGIIAGEPAALSHYCF